MEFALKRYRDKVENGELTIVGALYDFANLYGRGKGKVLVVNINGLKSVISKKLLVTPHSGLGGTGLTLSTLSKTAFPKTTNNFLETLK